MWLIFITNQNDEYWPADLIFKRIVRMRPVGKDNKKAHPTNPGSAMSVISSRMYKGIIYEGDRDS